MWFLTLVLRNHYLFFLLLVLFFFFKVPSKIEMHYTRVNTVPSHQWCVASYHKKYTFCKTSFFCKLLIFLFFLSSPVKRLMHGLTSIVVEYFSCVISFFSFNRNFWHGPEVSGLPVRVTLQVSASQSQKPKCRGLQELLKTKILWSGMSWLAQD